MQNAFMYDEARTNELEELPRAVTKSTVAREGVLVRMLGLRSETERLVPSQSYTAKT